MIDPGYARLPYRPAAPAPRAPGRPLVGNMVSGILLIAAAGLAVGGSFADLDSALTFSATKPNTLLDTTSTSPWALRIVNTDSNTPGVDVAQFYGVALVAGGVLATVFGVLLFTGLGARLRSWSIAAGALLFGAILTTEMVAIDDMQFDATVPDGTYRTGFSAGFWLLGVAGLVAPAAVCVLLVARSAPGRAEPPTVPSGIPAFRPPPAVPPPGSPYPPSPPDPPGPPPRTGNRRMRDLLAGIVLLIAAGLAVGGSFADLDRAVNISTGSRDGILSTITSSQWYFHIVNTDPKHHDVDVGQFFGVALVTGGVLATVFGVLLFTGLAARFRSWGIAAGALLFGAILTTEMSVVSDMQFDAAISDGAVHRTAVAPGFWLLVAAGLVISAAVCVLLLAPGRLTSKGPAGR